MVKSNKYIHDFKIKLLVLNPCIYLLNSMCTITINLFRWNQIEIYYMLFVLFKWNQIDICGLKKTIHTHSQWGIKKFILWNVRDEKIHFVKCEGLWIGLCKIWFDNFAPKKWPHASHVMNSYKKLVRNLGRNQIWPM